MEITFTDSPCPHDYFPDHPEIEVMRRLCFFGEELMGYMDFYNTEDTTYFLTLFVEENFRNGRYVEIVDEYGSKEPGTLPGEVLMVGLKQNRVMLNTNQQLLDRLQQHNTWLRAHREGRAKSHNHFVSGAELIYSPETNNPEESP